MPYSRSLGVVSQHALQISKPRPREEVEGSGQDGSPGPHASGKLRGLAGGGLQGPGGCLLPGGLQAHTWGWGLLQGGLLLGWGVETPRDCYCCGQ